MSKCMWTKRVDVDELERCNDEAAFVITTVHGFAYVQSSTPRFDYAQRCITHTSEFLHALADDPTTLKSLIVVAIE